MKHWLYCLFVPLGLWAEARDMRGMPALHWTRHVTFGMEARSSVFAGDQPVEITLTIRNKGYQVVRFYPDTVPLHTFKFLVIDQAGREVPRKPVTLEEDQLTRHIVSREGEKIKEIQLQPQESFSRRVRLEELYALRAGERYRVTAYFYPDFRQTFFLKSGNTLAFRILPGQERFRDFQGQSAESRPGITPEEAVYLFLSAEMARKWENYFKYIDFPRFITAYDRFASRYAAADKWEKSAIVRDFQNYLSQEPADQLKSFKIVQSEPERAESGQVLLQPRSTVTVEAMREKNGYKVRYRYDYVLEKKDDFWKITYVTARVVR